jgi:acyl-CoA synthetase (NDP forming)
MSGCYCCISGFAARTRTLAESALNSGKPVLSVMLPGAAAEKPRAVLRELDCPYFDSVEDLLSALRGMFDYYRFAPTISTLRRPADLPTSLPSLTDLAQLVTAYGIAVPRAVTCATSDQAVAAATTIGFPVVLKGSVSGVTHKTNCRQ